MIGKFGMERTDDDGPGYYSLEEVDTAAAESPPRVLLPMYAIAQL